MTVFKVELHPPVHLDAPPIRVTIVNRQTRPTRLPDLGERIRFRDRAGIDHVGRVSGRVEHGFVDAGALLTGIAASASLKAADMRLVSLTVQTR